MHVKTYLISKDADYHELVLEDGYINKIYRIDNPDKDIYAIPDACLDLQFVYEGSRFVPYVCGTHTEVSRAFISGSTKTFAIKFEPGVIPDFMKDYANELVCTRKNVSEVAGLNHIAELFSYDMTFEEMADIFISEFKYETYFYEDYCKERKNLVIQIAAIILHDKGHVAISDVADRIGYNQRYLDRVFKNSLGVSMKKYAGIIRIQKAIYYLQNNLTYEIYDRLGYYDQAHFIKDFKKNTSLTPNQFERTNGELNIV